MDTAERLLREARRTLNWIAEYAAELDVRGKKLSASRIIDHASGQVKQLDAHLSSESKESTDRKLTKPAQVGNGRFGIGVSERLVIERAQREYQYQNTPEREAERIKRVDEFMNKIEESAAQGTPETDAAELDALICDMPNQQTTDKVVRSIIARSLERRLREALEDLRTEQHAHVTTTAKGANQIAELLNRAEAAERPESKESAAWSVKISPKREPPGTVIAAGGNIQEFEREAAEVRARNDTPASTTSLPEEPNNTIKSVIVTKGGSLVIQYADGTATSLIASAGGIHLYDQLTALRSLLAQLEERIRGLVRALSEAQTALYNGFEPDNQSLAYKRASAALAKDEAAERLLLEARGMLDSACEGERELNARIVAYLSSSESKGMVMVSVEQLKALREQVVTLQTHLHEFDGILSKESAAHYDASVDRPAPPAPTVPGEPGFVAEFLDIPNSHPVLGRAGNMARYARHLRSLLAQREEKIRELEFYKYAWDEWCSLQTGDAKKLFDAAERAIRAESAEPQAMSAEERKELSERGVDGHLRLYQLKQEKAMTTPTPQSETPRTDHYRAEFKHRKETSDLIEWLLDEFAQEERRLREAEAQLDAWQSVFGTSQLSHAQARLEAAERGREGK